MKRYTIHFFVTPTKGFAFPIDMLRYDRCSPHTEEDSYKIARTFDGIFTAQEIGKIELQRPGAARTNKPTDGRWESFGWSVSGVTWTEETVR